ncbi:MAG: hypothetical protein JW912_01005 [Sedimentisphaerales bacterium]|nr:hypothetical protein [Sedimentisphaerales bacterium]
MCKEDGIKLFKENDLKSILIILLAALLVGIYLAATTVVISKDGVFYIESAKKLLTVPVEVMRERPCGYSYMILTAHRILNLVKPAGSVYSWIYCAQAVNMSTRLMSLAVLYFVGKFFVGGSKSFLAMFILVLLPYPAKMGSDVLREWPHMLFLYAGLLQIILGVKLEKRWLFGTAGLTSGLGFLIRPECAQIVIYGMIWLSIVLIKPAVDKDRHKTVLTMIILIAGFCIPAVPYVQASGKLLPTKLKEFLRNEPSEIQSGSIEEDGRNAVYTCSVLSATKASAKLAVRVNENLMYFFTPAALIGIYCYLKRSKNLFCVFLPVSLILFNITTMHLLYYNYGYMSRRHCLPLVVMLVFFVPDGLERSSRWLKDNVFKRYSFAEEGVRKLFIILLVLGVITGIPKLLGHIGSDKAGYIAAAKWLKENSEDDASVYSSDKRIAFYAERKILRQLSESKTALHFYLIEITEKDEEPSFAAKEGFSKEYTGWVVPKLKDRQIVIYKRIQNL